MFKPPSDAKSSGAKAPGLPEIDENTLLVVLDVAKKVFHDKKITGSLEVSNTVGFFTVTGSHKLGDDNVPLSNNVPLTMKPLEALAIASVENVVNSLIARAKAYRGRAFSEEDSLSSGVEISDPVLGAFSIGITVSASISSLLGAN